MSLHDQIKALPNVRMSIPQPVGEPSQPYIIVPDAVQRSAVLAIIQKWAKDDLSKVIEETINQTICGSCLHWMHIGLVCGFPIPYAEKDLKIIDGVICGCEG